MEQPKTETNKLGFVDNNNNNDDDQDMDPVLESNLESIDNHQPKGANVRDKN